LRKDHTDELLAVGADATYWMTPNGGHSFPGGNGFWKVLDDFIVRTLKLDVSNNHDSQ
jgi:hypothetical protein